MNRKKETSLTKKLLNYKTEKSLPKDHQQHQSTPKITFDYQNLSEISSLIQHYHVLKQQNNFNLSSKSIFQELKTNTNNDDEFCFDVDLGVPYVQSQHMDSGFLFDQKSNQTVNFPKISSAKEIFTSVLDFSKQSVNNQLDEQNFTDRENYSNLFGAQKQNNQKFKKRSRKDVSVVERKLFKESLDEPEYQSANFRIQILLEDQQKLMQKLKVTAQYRQEKLKFWNNKLCELGKSQNSTKNHSKVMQFDQQNSLCRINTSSSILQKCQNKNDRSHSKRSKFEKEPTIKNKKVNIKVENTKNKQNISPYKQKMDIKRNQNAKTQTSRMEGPKKISITMQNVQNFGNRNILDRRRQILVKNQTSSRSKDKNFVKKVF